MIDFTEVQKHLPHGAQREIATIVGVHYSLVHRVLKGKSKNKKVINAIADYLEAQKTAEKRLTSLIA